MPATPAPPTRPRPRRLLTALLATTVVAGLATACSSGSGGGTSSDPIELGAIATLSGPATFPESTAAAKAYFDKVNAAGGIGGRKIEYTVVDDAGDGGRAAQAARQLVDKDGVVALVGSASVPDCATNAEFYARSSIASVPGAGVLPQCFSSPNIAPTNTGLFAGLGVSLVHAVKDLGKTKPCVLSGEDVQAGVAPVLAAFTRQTGVQVTLAQQYPTDNSNWQSYLLRAQQAGCDVFVPAVAGPQLVALEKQITQLGLRGSMTFMELASAYNTQVAAAIQPGADGLVVNSEFLPFTGSGAQDPALSDYVSTMKGAGVALNSFGQGGYVSAAVLVEVLKGIEGDITAESVLKALQTMQPYETPLMGNPYVFGNGKTHQANVSSRFVELRGTDWEPVTTEWTTLQTGSQSGS
ncbi:ABC transporter substrate-binding protein [Kineococcus sp. NPDC059986]|uniref:ABC transporter substrate-binding protein n=1 Tax=Kineococcus sp. NPDC059986 TaxID=3155538 RepID=UPI00344B1340